MQHSAELAADRAPLEASTLQESYTPCRLLLCATVGSTSMLEALAQELSERQAGALARCSVQTAD